jgi:hypothetical protein
VNDAWRSRARSAALGACIALAACRGARDRQEQAPNPRPGREAAEDAGVVSLRPLPDERFTSVIRPLLSRHGCDATPCHGAFKGGGFYLPGGADVRDFPEVTAQIDREHPAESKLWKKAVGLLPHNGGQNLAPDECDARRLLAWIASEAYPTCEPLATGAADLGRFTRRVAPALTALGCAAAACHGGDGAARAKLDLGSLSPKEPRGAEHALASFEETRKNRVVPWKSQVLMAAWGEGAAVHRRVDLASCAYEHLHGFVAHAPEVACELRTPRPDVHELETTTRTAAGVASEARETAATRCSRAGQQAAPCARASRVLRRRTIGMRETCSRYSRR